MTMSSVFAHVPYAVEVDAQPHYSADDSQSMAFIHDPYSFAAYITLKDEPQYRYCRRLSSAGSDDSERHSDCLSSSFPSLSPSDHIETSSEDGNAIAPADCGRRGRRVRFVRGPCGHKNSKRLRFKNGKGQYICLECNLKWRSALEEETK